ncbi:uncharacterized protein LAESUDRAFT_702717 [Laetiporus sulphureus 93-53]|uniref:NAD(P)-binding protein n=1 Tax=Laetiporus sulphureus 93-53 TaxID=1314785 RepID=A0A165DLE9_9APHY|nr:uncharacterized protein LAESUDRAFT_702717 [Laetiporus sulphureus 93-53]KZT05141.1 hypothetical protein LAESUDRAFT_702717 [Laetiporus sulphureus 93-53]
MHEQQLPLRPIVVVTGSNGGVGFGICHRLLCQLAQRNPPDAEPRFTSLLPPDVQPGRQFDVDHSEVGMTLVMACRSALRAQRAKMQLEELLEAFVEKIPRGTKEYGYALRYMENVRIDICQVDLSDVGSVLRCGREITRSYPYVSHLICNAGLATYSHLDFGVFFRQAFASPTAAVRNPAFNIQKAGVLSKDNLGYVWQCNVFGHYVLFRSLQSALSAYALHCPSRSQSQSPARVVWLSSVDALPTYDPISDWQLTKTDKSYQASKAQIDYMVMELAQKSNLMSQATRQDCGTAQGKIDHLLVSPGITSTKVAADLLRPKILEYCMLAFFYFCRLLGSPHLLFSTYKAAIAASYAALTPSTSIPAFTSFDEQANIDGNISYADVANTAMDARAYPKFSAMSDRWGHEHVGIVPVVRWEKHPDEGRAALERCERLYKAFVKAEGVEGKAENGHADNSGEKRA